MFAREYSDPKSCAKIYPVLKSKHPEGHMNFHRTTLAISAALALVVGGLTPAAQAAPPHSCWSWSDEEDRPFHMECSQVESLADLEVPTTVTELRILNQDESTIAGLERLKDMQQLISVEIYGATNEAVAAAAQLPNLKKLWVTFLPASGVTEATRTALTKMTKLTSLTVQDAGLTDYSWVAAMPLLEEFKSNETHSLSKGWVGKTLAFAPIVGVDGRALVPHRPSGAADPQPVYTKLTATSVLPMVAGSNVMVATSDATTGSSLISSDIYVVLVTDVFDTAKSSPLRVNYHTARKGNSDSPFAIVGDELEIPWGSYAQKNFQWFRNAVAVPGATGRTYKLTPADAGKKITAKYTSVEKTSWDKKIVYVPTATLSTEYDLQIPASESAHPAAKLTGTGFVTEKLSVALDPTVFPHAQKTYQWFKDDTTAIKGATGPTFIPDDSLNLKRVHAVVTFVGAHAEPVELISKSVKIDHGNLKSGKPTISGSVRVGSKLTAKPGTVSKQDAKLTYIWLRNGKEIFQQNRSTYTLVPADLGKKISVKTQFTHRYYNTVVTQSTATKTVAPGTLKVSKKPTLSGKKIVGKTVKASSGAYSPIAEKVTYQWQRSGKNIKGATKSGYRVTKADKGKKLTVKVSAIKKGYTTKSSVVTAN